MVNFIKVIIGVRVRMIIINDYNVNFFMIKNFFCEISDSQKVKGFQIEVKKKMNINIQIFGYWFRLL